MYNLPIANVRNFVIVGHSGSGKTALTDALAFKLGLNDRLGSSAAGSSVSDYTDEEKNRKISVFSASFQANYTAGGTTYGLQFTDTPGFMDFHGQLMAACRAADTALVTVDASGGVQVGTRRGWKAADQQGIVARTIVITGLDKDNTAYAATLEKIQAAFGDKCVPIALLSKEKKLVSVFAKDIPAELADEAEAARQKITELAAEADDALMEKFFSEGTLSDADRSTGLSKAAAAGTFVPVLPVFPLTGEGIPELLDTICLYFANPAQRARKDAGGTEINPAFDRPFFGIVWKTVSDAFVGQMSYIRVLSGTLSTNTEVENPRAGGKEKVGALLVPQGKKQVTVPAVTAGDIVAIPKLAATQVGDTLCAMGNPLRAAPLVFPSPVMFAAVTAKTQGDEDKMGAALHKLTEQDPTLKVERNTETKETILGGLGDVHLDTAVHLLKQMNNVNVDLKVPKTAYRETVNGLGEGHHKHKKQSGGRGQYGEVYLKVERLQEGDEEWYTNETVGGSIPRNFIPAIEKGIVEAKEHGVIAGYTVVNLKCRVYDGSFHDVDSSEIAFKIAGAKAFRDAMAKAKPVLLEPIMTVRISSPDQFMGNINGDLSNKRGRVMGMDMEDGMQVITAEIPQAELARYAAELRSITGGQGSFSMEFNRYDTVPSALVAKIVAESPYKHAETEE